MELYTCFSVYCFRQAGDRSYYFGASCRGGSE